MGELRVEGGSPAATEGVTRKQSFRDRMKEKVRAVVSRFFSQSARSGRVPPQNSSSRPGSVFEGPEQHFVPPKKTKQRPKLDMSESHSSVVVEDPEQHFVPPKKMKKRPKLDMSE